MLGVAMVAEVLIPPWTNGQDYTNTESQTSNDTLIVTLQHLSTEVGLQTVFETSVALYDIEYLRLMY